MHFYMYIHSINIIYFSLFVQTTQKKNKTKLLVSINRINIFYIIYTILPSSDYYGTMEYNHHHYHH